MSKAIIFDFDGTLVDSEQAIYECFQSITKHLTPERMKYAKNILIGPPLRDTASEILGPENQSYLDKFVKLFIQLHDEKIIIHTKPYPYVVNILSKLYENNISMAIATNKRRVPTIKLIDHFGWKNYFKFIECTDSESKMRNKDAMIQDILNADHKFNEAIFVGDTVNDGISANLNQLTFIKATYGYGREQDWSSVNIKKSIGTFAELESILI